MTVPADDPTVAVNVRERYERHVVHLEATGGREAEVARDILDVEDVNFRLPVVDRFAVATSQRTAVVASLLEYFAAGRHLRGLAELDLPFWQPVHAVAGRRSD